MTSQDKPKNYMEELDAWTKAEVIEPLMDAIESGSDNRFLETSGKVQRAIRGKVLESYHNGQKAGPRKR
jgi:hypothetical protein